MDEYVVDANKLRAQLDNREAAINSAALLRSAHLVAAGRWRQRRALRQLAVERAAMEERIARLKQPDE